MLKVSKLGWQILLFLYERKNDYDYTSADIASGVKASEVGVDEELERLLSGGLVSRIPVGYKGPHWFIAPNGQIYVEDHPEEFDRT
jgi:predicted transcriptional regulator